MKRGTPDHPKVADLCRLLNIGKAEAVGTLELLWHFTAKFAPQGDVGRFPDEAIAAAVGWNHRSGVKGVSSSHQLISALVKSGWLDSSHPVPGEFTPSSCLVHSQFPPSSPLVRGRFDSYRLIVHDWKDHADQAVIKHLSRHRLDMYGKCPDKNSLPEPLPEPLPLPIVPTVQAPPTKRVKPTQPDPEREAWFMEWYTLYPKHVKRDKAKVAFRKQITSRELYDKAVDGVKRKMGGLDNPDPHFFPHPASWLNDKPWEDDPPLQASLTLVSNQRPVQQTFAERNEQLRNQRFIERMAEEITNG